MKPRTFGPASIAGGRSLPLQLREGAAHIFHDPPNVSDVRSVKKINPNQMVHLTEKTVEQTGRHAFLIELDPLYTDVIAQRWEKFTGRKAERVESPASQHSEALLSEG